jgi:mono/diheme cytochrome c family protein
VEQGDILVLALVILVPAALLWGVFLKRTSRPRKPASILGIPMAMRPGSPDEVLEGNRLERIQVVAVLSTLVAAFFIPAYWLPEADRQEAFQERFDEEAVHRGSLIYDTPPQIEEDADPTKFKEVEEALALGQGCINCHGPLESDSGGSFQFSDPIAGRVTYKAPPLNNVFTRWDEEIIRFTIERGRPGTDMPAWGVEYGGSMTTQMIDDVMAYLQTFETNQTPPELPEDCDDPEPGSPSFETCGEAIFEARCAVCHGPEGQGKDETGRNAVWYQGMALWKGKVTHLPEDQHKATIINGRRYAFMPAFGESPAQGIPIPAYPLTNAQIEAVMAYERNL